MASEKARLKNPNDDSSNRTQIPFVLVCSKGDFLRGILTPPFDELRAGFWKRGEGEIFMWIEGGSNGRISETGH